MGYELVFSAGIERYDIDSVVHDMHHICIV